jgi:uncharacterized membrane protein YdjX (TVP38/TMEM64 family)
MEKSKKFKIFIGLFYLIIVSTFLFIILTKFNFEDLTSYKFIQDNREYLFNIKNNNLFLMLFIFFILTIIWVFLLGFGTPIALLGGFIFGKWIGIIVVAAGLSFGSLFLYIFANFFLKKIIIEKFSHKFSYLEYKFKRNEFIYFFLYRFIGGIPFAIANLLPVLFNINLKNYFMGTFLGIIPQLFVYVSLGTGIEKIINKNNSPPPLLDLLFSSEIYLPIIGFIFLILVTIIVRKLFYKK